MDGGFHTKALSRAFPRYSDLPFEQKMRAGVRDWAVYASRLRYLADFSRFVALRRRDWLHPFDGMLASTLVGHLSSHFEDAARFLPTALYLLQLKTFAEEGVANALSTFGFSFASGTAESSAKAMRLPMNDRGRRTTNRPSASG